MTTTVGPTSDTTSDTTFLEAAARDLIDVGVWVAAGGQDREGRERSNDKDSQCCSLAEEQFRKARACLVRAQAERTEAVSRFLAAKAEWEAVAAPWQTADATLPPTFNAFNPLESAETELRRAKSLYCVALEQNQLMQNLLRRSRVAFQQAQEHLEQLAMSDCSTTSLIARD